MKDIEKSFTELTQAINNNKSISLNTQGEWKVDGFFTRLIKWILGFKEKSKLKVCKATNQLFDQLERRELFFNADTNTTNQQKKLFKGYINVANAACKALEKSKSKQAKSTVSDLKRRIVGLTYRIEAENGGLDKDSKNKINNALYKKLVVKAAAWKKKQKIFTGKDSELHPIDINHLKEACTYPEFVKLLLSTPSMQSEFFSWTIKNTIPPSSIIQYPSISGRLRQCLMVGRIGRFSYANVLSINKEALYKNGAKSPTSKNITLPFNNKKVSLLNEDRYVEFRGNYMVKIRDVFEDMGAKNTKPGGFEFIGTRGFRNWSSHKLAYWDARTEVWKRINLTKKNWWELLPEFETIEKEDVMARYGIKKIENNQWVLLGRSARQSAEYRIDDCHGYSGVLIPDGNGKWRVYDWGKYAKQWPQGKLGAFGIVGDTVPAVFTYPDCNDHYSGFRQQAAVPFVCSEAEGIKYMNKQIVANIIDGRNGNLVFMFGFENCSFSPQTDLEEVLGKEGEGGRVPNLFISHVLTSDAAEPLGFIFRNVAKVKGKMREKLVTLCDICLLSSRGVYVTSRDGKRVFKSLASSPFRKGFTIPINGKPQKKYNHIFLPSHLHRLIIENKIGGVIWAGHHRMWPKKHVKN